jgi:hypothetical protein
MVVADGITGAGCHRRARVSVTPTEIVLRSPGHRGKVPLQCSSHDFCTLASS